MSEAAQSATTRGGIPIMTDDALDKLRAFVAALPQPAVVVLNDLVGGWSVGNKAKPQSQYVFDEARAVELGYVRPEGEPPDALYADFMTEQDAHRVVGAWSALVWLVPLMAEYHQTLQWYANPDNYDSNYAPGRRSVLWSWTYDEGRRARAVLGTLTDRDNAGPPPPIG